MTSKFRTLGALAGAVLLVACASSATVGSSGAAAPASEPAPQANAATAMPALAGDDKLQFEALLARAEKGDLDAQFVLAQAYEQGQAMPANAAQAFFWYGKAANAGYVPAQYFLAAMYGSGRGTPMDMAKAVEWFKKAAEQGYPEAIYPLAFAYENGMGVPLDSSLALAWYRKAADAGNPFAFWRLAKAYRLGELGLAIDLEQAALYAARQKAADGGAKMQSLPAGKP